MRPRSCKRLTWIRRERWRRNRESGARAAVSACHGVGGVFVFLLASVVVGLVSGWAGLGPDPVRSIHTCANEAYSSADQIQVILRFFFQKKAILKKKLPHL